MKLLIFTQALDVTDPVLSVYFDWVKEISRNFDFTTVITLKKDKSTNLDSLTNAKVFSLGKEDGESRIKYILNFYKYIWRERKNYNAVFVHMNQEYVLLGSLFWKFMGKKVYMWRNHHAGSLLTDISAMFCEKVFCTSKFSYTAKYKKTVLMPVGVDVEKFRKQTVIGNKLPASILFLARIAPSKRLEVLLVALKILKDNSVDFTASIYGDCLPKDRTYYDSLIEYRNLNCLNSSVHFYPGVSNAETVHVYNQHEISVNTSSSGMYDKTIFEAMACETLILASNENLKGLINPISLFKESDASDLAQKLERLINLPLEEKKNLGNELRKVVMNNHSLKELGVKLAKEIS